jgi:hypothetical protein
MLAMLHVAQLQQQLEHTLLEHPLLQVCMCGTVFILLNNVL